MLDIGYSIDLPNNYNEKIKEYFNSIQIMFSSTKISINDIFYAHPELDVRTSVLFKEYEYRMDINL